MQDNKKTAVLLATYNGSAYLDAQLCSIADQSWKKIDIWVSDDGSTDGTLKLLSIWQAKWTKGDFKVITGPCKGFVENFRHLIISVDITDSYVAFSDQDDVWHKDKLSIAITKLRAVPKHKQAMYCSRSRLIDQLGNEIGFSPLFKKSPSFTNAIVQSLAGGNTMVLNSLAFSLIRESAVRTSFFSHDWWCYQVLAGSGAHIEYDPSPQIDYRQHQNNIWGRNNGVRAHWRRIRGLVTGQLGQWIEINLGALLICKDLLNKKNREFLEEFQTVRKKGRFKLLAFLYHNGVKRQTMLATVGIYFAAIIGKL